MLMNEKMRNERIVAKFTTFVDWPYNTDSLWAIGMMILLSSPLIIIAQAAKTIITHL